MHCSTCGKDATKKCTRCKRVAYCDAKCQKSDWKDHKTICFADGTECTRCMETIDGSNIAKCTVPHPTHLLRDMGSMFGPTKQWNFSCEACGESFSKSSKGYDSSVAPITHGAKFCYCGPHTIKPLPNGDQRRKSTDVLVLNAGPKLQKEIDGIPTTMPNVRILTIQSTGLCDSSISPNLEVPMPKLETLKLIDVLFNKVRLNNELTPLIEELSMQNIPEECDLTVNLPELKSFSMHYYGPPDDDGWIHDMLSTATKLERFDSYKLRVGPELHFVSNDLRYVRLHRAELLDSLSIYAPKLEELSLQGCYGLDGELTILDSHPKFKRPSGRLSTFIVNATNACLSPSICQTLRSNHRVLYDDDEGNVSNPMEGMFANMHGMMRG